jgi:Fic family protein
MRGVRGQHATPGEFRRSQNWIGAAGAFLKDATFVPPPPNALPDLLGSFERYLHSNDDLPLLIKLGLIHVGECPARC